jgi:hypothetical protein
MTQRKKIIRIDDCGYGWEDLYFAYYEALENVPQEGGDLRATLWALSALVYTYLRAYEQWGGRDYHTLEQIRIISDWPDVDPEKIRPEMKQVLDAISRISDEHDRKKAVLNHIQALVNQCAPVDWEFPDIHKRPEEELLPKLKALQLGANTKSR